MLAFHSTISSLTPFIDFGESRLQYLKVGVYLSVSGVRIFHPGFFFGKVFLAFEVEAGAHFGEP